MLNFLGQLCIISTKLTCKIEEVGEREGGGEYL